MDEEFKFFMPIQKDIGSTDDGLYHIKVGVASGLKDKQGDTLSLNFLKSIVEQLKSGISVDGSRLRIPMDDNHKDGLQSIVGSVHNAWIEGNKVMADFVVADEWKSIVKGLLKVGAKLGGSIKGTATARNYLGELDDGHISKIALTDTPAAWDLRGTAEECTMCAQISKTLNLEKSWDGSASRFTDEQYKASTLWCDPKVAAGTMSAKSGCHLPVKDPGGKLNPDGVKAAWGAVNGARNSPNMPPAAIAAAKSKLKGYYKQLGMTDIGPFKKSEEDEKELQILEKLENVLDLGINIIKERS